MPIGTMTKRIGSDGGTGCEAEYEETLRQMIPYISARVRRKMPQTIIPRAVLEFEIDEIAQRTTIKLWQAMQQKQIVNVKSYSNRIIYTEIIDTIRKYKPTVALPLDEDGELYQEHIQPTLSCFTPDPAEQFVHAETYHHLLATLAQAILTLPTKQQFAMICALKDYSIGNSAFVRTFSYYGLDINGADWPTGLRELRSLRTSLSIARKKLRVLKEVA